MKNTILILSVFVLTTCYFAKQYNTTDAMSLTNQETYNPDSITFSGKSNEQLKAEAEAGVVESQHELGVNYYNSGEPVTARIWFQKAAEQGFARSQNELGLLYLDGEGVTCDRNQAAMWFEKAAEQGHAGAMNNLGSIYAENEDYEKAVVWFERSAGKGYIEGLYNLAMCYLEGKGVEQNKEKAKQLLKSAADKGDYISAYALKKLDKEK